MGLAYRLVRPEPTIREIVNIKNDPLLRLTTSPFGVTPEQYVTRPPLYIGNSAPWKGMKGLGLEGFAKALVAGTGLHGKISMANREKLIKGLRLAVKISKAYRDVRGTELWNGKLYPSKCIAQKRWRDEHPELS